MDSRDNPGNKGNRDNAVRAISRRKPASRGKAKVKVRAGVLANAVTLHSRWQATTLKISVAKASNLENRGSNLANNPGGNNPVGSNPAASKVLSNRPRNRVSRDSRVARISNPAKDNRAVKVRGIPVTAMISPDNGIAGSSQTGATHRNSAAETNAVEAARIAPAVSTSTISLAAERTAPQILADGKADASDR